MKVYFKNSNGKEILKGKTDNDDDAIKIIDDFCDERGFHVYYKRFWTDPYNYRRTICDYGSHNEFFIIEY